MVSQKREELLSEKERERLKTRDALDPRTRAANDIRVKRKLGAWMKGIDDVLLILEHLPKDTILKIAKDDVAIMRLVTASIEMMRMMGYRPIVGNVGQPESWSAIKKTSGGDPKVPVTDVDIVRSANLTLFSLTLETLLGSESNPVSAAIGYNISKNGPAIIRFLREHPDIADDYQKALNRIREAGSTMIATEEEKHIPHQPKRSA
jgi:hypothetical protein